MSFTRAEKKELIQFIKDNHLKIKHHEGWENFSKNLKSDGLVLDIEDVASLKAYQKKIFEMNQKKAAKNRTVNRPAAGGRKDKISFQDDQSQSYTFSTEVFPSHIVHRMPGKDFLKIEHTGQEGIVRAGASLQVFELHKALFENKDFLLTIPTSSLIGLVTLAGLASNAGHGTGKNQPSFAGLMTAYIICLPNGRVVRARNAEENTVALSKDEMERLEIDEDIAMTAKEFSMMQAHLGLFGTIISVEIKCTEAKKTKCIIEPMKMAEFKARETEILSRNEVSVMILNVTKEMEKQVDSVVVYEWQDMPLDTPDVDNHPELSFIAQAAEIAMFEKLHLSDLLRKVPSIVPYYNAYFVAKFAIGTKTIEMIGPDWIRHYQRAFPWDIGDIDCLRRIKNDEEASQVLNQYLDVVDDFAKNDSYPITGAIYIRRLTGSNGGLSTSYHEDGENILAVDAVSTRNIKDFDKLQAAWKKITYDNKGVLHLGKEPDVDYSSFGERLTAFNEFLENWYKRFGLKLEESSLLNDTTCRKLHLPESYVPEMSDCALVETAREDDVNVADIARGVIEMLDRDLQCDMTDVQQLCLHHFRKELKKLTKHDYTNHCSSFQSKPAITNDKVAEPAEPKARSWCSIS